MFASAYSSLNLCILLSLFEACSLLPILVQQVCRHGDRSPCDVFPNNKNVDKWEQGLGYLTPLGESQLYANGKSFRELWYPGLLSDVVYPSEIRVISSDVDRAIMSANSFLASLYPPTGPYVFEPGLNWQAFPVHTISPSLDYYLYGTDCPAWNHTLNTLYALPNYTSFVNANLGFINYVCKEAGYPASDWTVQSVVYTYDNLFCDKAHNFSLPPWATNDVLVRMRNVVNLAKELQYTDQASNYLDTGGGPLLGLMVENIMNKKTNNLTQKFIYYSAHDATVLPFMGNLDQPVGPIPPYASCAFLELYQISDGRFQVQLTYKNSTKGQIQEPRMIPGCNDFKCDLDIFMEVVQSKANFDPKTACFEVNDR